MDMPPGYSPDRSKTSVEVRASFPATLTYEEFYGIPDDSFPPGFDHKKIEEKTESVKLKAKEPTEPKELKEPKEPKESKETPKPAKEEPVRAEISVAKVESHTEAVTKEKNEEKNEMKKEKSENNKEKSEEDSWVTVKPKMRKKAGAEGTTAKIVSSASAQKFENFAEMQLSTSKVNKKKSLKKKLKEIKELLAKQAGGEKLNAQQLQKVQAKEKLEKELFALN